MTSPNLPSLAETVAKYEPVIGFEVHVELNTVTKMFSSSPNAFGDEPNTNITEVDVGLPGTLPTMNYEAIEAGITLGLALNCSIAETCRFARKHYFYPDVPKNFQISQYDEPIAFDGWVDVELDDGELFRVEIERAHLEEDAGKLHHVGDSGRIDDASYALVDYNRAGVPLIEIVTKPITGAGERAPEVARAYVRTIRDIVKALNISAARMEQGNLRCDANVSLQSKGAAEFGTRTETKNVNSLRSVGYAVEHEMRRQAHLLSTGAAITQETRHWQENSRTTSAGRTKSNIDDYRHFREPDLAPVHVDRQWLQRLRAELPELPDQRRRRLKAEWGTSDATFRDLVHAGALDVIEATVVAGATPAVARKWWMGELARLTHERDTTYASLGVTPQDVVELEALIAEGQLNDKLARQVLSHVADGEGSPREIVTARALAVVSDDAVLGQAIDVVIAEHPEVVDKVTGGKLQAVDALIGPVMRATGGQADTQRVRELILLKLGVTE